MKSFVDNENQKWVMQWNLQKLRKYREKLGLDLLNPRHYMQVLESLTDRLAFCFLLCEEQAKELHVSVDEFEERLYGDGVANEASIAFLNECEHFFQKLGQKAMAELTKKTVESMKAGQTRLDEMMTNGQLDSLWKQAEKEMETLLQPNGGDGSPS